VTLRNSDRRAGTSPPSSAKRGQHGALPGGPSELRRRDGAWRAAARPASDTNQGRAGQRARAGLTSEPRLNHMRSAPSIGGSATGRRPDALREPQSPAGVQRASGISGRRYR
jgi:hypothetical protein